MPDVFLSYGREDRPIARRFAEALEREGFSVWWDQTLDAGQTFDKVIEKVLDEARAVVVLWSRHSVESSWVRAEATQAHANQRLVPVTIEPCKRPIIFELTHTADLVGWNGSTSDPRWRTLVDGLRRLTGRSGDAPALAAAHPAARPAYRRVAWIAGAVALLAIAVAVVWFARGRNGGSAPATAADASIAVLPFVNMSGDRDQEYFSDGLSEELINQLAHINGLRVTARTSAFAFKGHAEDLRTVARTLGVAHILEGSVRKAGGKIRVTAQLINAADGSHIWSVTYDRALNDVFAIQDEIASAVAAKLGPSLGVAPNSADYGGTRSFEAYDHLLRGTTEFAKASPQGFQAAIEEYRAALAIDPGYARASAELAIVLSAQGASRPNTAELESERQQAVDRAIEIAPDAPLSQVANMWRHSDRHEWIDADAACARAFAAARDPRAEWICGGFLSVTGRVRAALPYREAARRADPLSMGVGVTVVRQYAFLDMEPELLREYARLDGLPGSRAQADEAMLAHRMHKGAPLGEVAELMARLCPTMTEPCLTWVRAFRSPDQARSMLRTQLNEVGKTAPGVAAEIALWAAYLGDDTLALDALDVLSRASGTAVYQNMWYPLLSEVRKTPRFKEIVSRIGYVDLWRRTGRWADYCRPLGETDFECF